MGYVGGTLLKGT